MTGGDFGYGVAIFFALLVDLALFVCLVVGAIYVAKWAGLL